MTLAGDASKFVATSSGLQPAVPGRRPQAPARRPGQFEQ